MTYPAQKELFQTSLTEVSATDLEGVGTLRWDGANAYRWVKNLTASVTEVGEVVFHDMSAYPNSTLVESVLVCKDVDKGMMAGVCLSVMAVNGFGWIQVFGVCTSVIVAEQTATVTAIGDYLVGVEDAVHGLLDASVQPQYSRNIQALAVLTSTLTTTKMLVCQVNCL